MWHIAVSCVSGAYTIDHLTLRLLFDEVVLYAALVLLAVLHLRVAEGVADSERHTIDGYLDLVMAGEVLAAAAALNHDAATVVETCECRYAQVQLVLQQRLRQTGGEEVETAAPSLQGVALGRGDGKGTELQVPRQCLLHASHDVGGPSVVALSEGIAVQVDIV